MKRIHQDHRTRNISIRPTLQRVMPSAPPARDRCVPGGRGNELGSADEQLRSARAALEDMPHN
ncbi:hypothetical protein JYU34_009301 [Plutella xylostella]|uniref:Uncharacterized protein n=1 Tax=Plutella xylostella TaxID=51655 RepID=A0ABQ7QMP7_PLUXY|nr:hypothetical protein JYU34_009301 [Plutella xylostella]